MGGVADHHFDGHEGHDQDERTGQPAAVGVGRYAVRVAVTAVPVPVSVPVLLRIVARVARVVRVVEVAGHRVVS